MLKSIQTTNNEHSENPFINTIYPENFSLSQKIMIYGITAMTIYVLISKAFPFFRKNGMKYVNMRYEAED